MQTQLTREGRVVRRIVLRYLGKALIIGFKVGGALLVLRLFVSWMQSPSAPPARVEAPAPVVYEAPQRLYIPHITSIDFGAGLGKSIPNANFSKPDSANGAEPSH